MTEQILRGSESLAAAADFAVRRTIDRSGADFEASFPGTAYVCPVLYAFTGIKARAVRHLSECLQALRFSLSGPEMKENLHKAGISAAAAAEVLSLLEPGDDSCIFSDDTVRTLGVRLLSGEVPGIAVFSGTAAEDRIRKYVSEARDAGLAVFLSGPIAAIYPAAEDALVYRSGKDGMSLIQVLSLMFRLSLIFREAPAGKPEEVLRMTADAVPGFLCVLGEMSEEAAALAVCFEAAGFAVTRGTGSGCSDPGVFSCVPEEESTVLWSMEKRGIRAKPKPVCLPVPFDTAFEGEILRAEETAVFFSSSANSVCELVSAILPDQIADGEVRVIGPELQNSEEATVSMPLALSVEVAGNRMQPDFEAVLERQMTRWLNCICGVMHSGQRDRMELRISRTALQQGLRLADLGRMLHTMFRTEFSSVAEKCRITFYTDPEEAERFLREIAQPRYAARDARMADLCDENVPVYYRCTMCQSIAPNHCCIVTPERPGLCGAVNWLDAKASYELNPNGPDRPVSFGIPSEPKFGQFDAVNAAVAEASHGTVTQISLYSFVNCPMTSCSRYECICALESLSGGAVVIDRDYAGETPTGMPAEDLAAMIRGGEQTPGFMGHSGAYLLSPKFIAADGGILRIVWMNRALKQQVGGNLDRLAEERYGVRNFCSRIADENVTTDPEQLQSFLMEKGHPVFGMESIM